jgi:large subunit ribosomal protein L18
MRRSKLTPREKRHTRVRRRVHGTPERPRLNVFRSSHHIYAQVIDDEAGRTLAAASTLDPGLRPELSERTKVEEARLVGRLVGERARARGVSKVVFDRGGWLYHGRVKSLAEGARESGLEF